MHEEFGIAAFRSRQQVMLLEGACRRMGLRTQVVLTPRDVSVGCGLSLRFDMSDVEKVLLAYDKSRPGNLIGFYHVEREDGFRPVVRPIRTT